MRSNLYLIWPWFILMGCDDMATKNEALNLRETPVQVEMFGEGIVSTPYYERDIAISANGDEIIYTMGDYKQNIRCLVSMKKLKGKWSVPEILGISGKYQDIEPFLAPKGDRLYFASNRPIADDPERKDYNLWYSDRRDGKWMDPVALDTTINTEGDEFYPSISNNGNLYFTATRKDGIGREDIFRAVHANGTFLKPVPLDTMVNTQTYEFNAYISPEEDLLIFSSYGRSDDLGGGDLYSSQKDGAGKWTKAENMGAIVNSEKLDYCPFIDWERNNFYFTSERGDNTRPDIRGIEDLKKMADSPSNGFGNIYRIGLDQLKLH